MTDTRSSSPRRSASLTDRSAAGNSTRAGGADGREPSTGWAGRPPMSLRLGDPSGFFRILNDILGPLAFLRYLMLPSLAVGFGVMWFNRYEYLAHVDRINSQLQFWQSMLFTILTVSLFGKITKGVVMHRHGAQSHEWGIKFSLGIVPRFYFGTGVIAQLSFRDQRTCYAASLQFRLVMFVVGILAWDMTRRSGTGTADLAVVVASVGLGSFLFIANPLFPADGYNWLSARVERPKLRSNSFQVLGMVFRRQPLPETLKPREFWLLLGYAVVSIAFTAFILFTVLTGVAYSLESSLGGTGMVIFALILASVSVFLLSLRERKQSKKQSKKASKRSRNRSDDQAADW